MKIEIRIERLILDGLPLAQLDGASIQAAVEAELVRLLADGAEARALAEGWGAGAALPRLSAPAISLPATPRPAEIGEQVARSVYGVVARNP